MSLRLNALHRTVLAVALISAVVGLLAWRCARDPKITFLPGDGRAEWILFHSAPDAGLRCSANLDAVFWREFILEDQPRSARVSVRAAKRVQLKINDRPVDIPASRNWKEISSADVLACVHAGTNTIEATVFNDTGPPALWLALATDRLTVRSDQTWEASFAGSAWRQAALASTPRMPGRGNLMSGGEQTRNALAAVWPIWVAFGGLAVVLSVAGSWWLRRVRTPNVPATDWPPSREAIALLIVLATLWVALFCNNARLLPRVVGFDPRSHLSYINYIQERHALPLPNEGWEMYQPPLYYGTSAVALSVFGLSVADEAGVTVLRLFAMLFGICHFTLVFLGLRLLFPVRTGLHMVGLMLAAFLPMHLYMSHYVTNETLAATLVTAAIYLCLRLLRAKEASASQYAWLGLCMGAALLTKATAVLLLPFVAVALAGKLTAQRAPMAIWLRNVGVMFAICFAVCGWYYIWIWLHFGTPLVGNWDVRSGFAWWQYPGYRTAANYARFGQSLAQPLFSAYAGFADGIYSTLWGDGLCGGVVNLNARPPWNYDLMVSGYLLALLPTLTILSGAVVALWRFVRTPSAKLFVLLGFLGAVAFGLVLMSLKLPPYIQTKAFYGLCALLPLCYFGVVGWDVLTRRHRLVRFALGTVLLVWAMNSFASVWIRGGSAPAHICLGIRLEDEGRTDAAASEFTKAVNAAPSNARARLCLASTLEQLGRLDEALQHAECAVELSPLDAACHLQLGGILGEQGNMERAISEARRAIELGPECNEAYRYLSATLVASGRYSDAVTVARDGLAAFPYDSNLHNVLGVALTKTGGFAAATNQFVYALLLHPDWVDAHLNLGLALIRSGNGAEGLKHLQEAVRLAPDSPDALNELAWLLATNPDAALRNGQEAVRLAERACELTEHRQAMFVGTLAAALAEDGQFDEARKMAGQAIALAEASGQSELAEKNSQSLKLYEAGKPQRETQ